MHIGNGNGTQYQEGKGSAEMSMPVDLRVILDEIARSQNLGDRVKNEIMQDEDSRNVCSPLFDSMNRSYSSMPRPCLCSALRVCDQPTLNSLIY